MMPMLPSTLQKFLVLSGILMMKMIRAVWTKTMTLPMTLSMSAIIACLRAAQQHRRLPVPRTLTAPALAERNDNP